MKRSASLVMALTLLLLNGAAASRLCACLDAIANESCCKQDMPCCEGGECKMHPDQVVKAGPPIDLLKALDAVSAIPSLKLPDLPSRVEAAPVATVPDLVRVRSPDPWVNGLRAPPIPR